MDPAGFYLGAHQPGWLAQLRVPLMVSYRRLRQLKRWPRAVTRWVLDSGGFMELAQHGRWTISPAEYAAAVRRARDEVGGLVWAAPQDWMTEPVIVAKTGLSVAEHLARTVGSYTKLRELAPDLPWIPVLQGQTLGDYEACAAGYARAGVDLARAPVVGLGSVCRRQATGEIEQIARSLAGGGLRLHGFGVKTLGFDRYADALVSADSLAWSFGARRTPVRLPGCDRHINCANCPKWALQWRGQVLSELVRPRVEQLRLPGMDNRGHRPHGRADDREHSR